MIDIFPAVDILGGCCVRLAKGDYETVSVYDENPERAAERFLQAGIRRLHVVDLDAAKAGHPVNNGGYRRYYRHHHRCRSKRASGRRVA